MRHTIYNGHSVLGLNVAGNSQANGQPIIQWQDSSSLNDAWCFRHVEDGYYEIIGQHSNQVLDVPFSSMVEGTPLIQWPSKSPENAANQLFKIFLTVESCRWPAQLDHCGTQILYGFDTENYEVTLPRPLSGTFPTEIGLATQLTTLGFAYDLGITGTIPTELGLLTNLADLTIRYNQLSGPLPSEMGRMTSLTNIELLGDSNRGSKQSSGTIPTEFGLLTNLVALAITENQLSGLIPTELGLLTALEWLGVNMNEFSGSIPSTLCNANTITIDCGEVECTCGDNCNSFIDLFLEVCPP